MFESTVELTPEQIEWLDKCTRGTWQLNPHTGLVDVDVNFSCNDQGLSDFKGVRFGKVVGGFYCSNNQLTTLEGAPQEVGWSFDCGNNQLSSLGGAPREVGGDFRCEYNQLTTLEGSPQRVGEDFLCMNNALTSLEGAPQRVGGVFHCDANPIDIRTLENIFRLMKSGESYLKAVESLWSKIPVEDQALLYRPEFKWVGPDEVKKLDTLRAYQGFKGML